MDLEWLGLSQTKSLVSSADVTVLDLGFGSALVGSGLAYQKLPPFDYFFNWQRKDKRFLPIERMG